MTIPYDSHLQSGQDPIAEFVGSVGGGRNEPCKGSYNCAVLADHEEWFHVFKT